MSGELNLNGRVMGRTADGRILVALTMEEYLESLPAIQFAAESARLVPAPLSFGGGGDPAARPVAAVTPRPARWRR